MTNIPARKVQIPVVVHPILTKILLHIPGTYILLIQNNNQIMITPLTNILWLKVKTNIKPLNVIRPK